MPRYIDADKIVYMECCEYDGFDLEGYPLYKRTTKADKTEIDDLPTEDVVPRAEVEKAKQEFAREIFEEIENEAYKNEEGDLFLDLPDYIKIKKKYIGE